MKGVAGVEAVWIIQRSEMAQKDAGRSNWGTSDVEGLPESKERRRVATLGEQSRWRGPDEPLTERHVHH